MGVIWSEGMLLTPHHLQVGDRLTQANAQNLLQGSLGNRWGVAKFSIDELELSRGFLDIRTIRALLPDGTFIDGGGGDPAPPTRAVPATTKTSKDLNVYIGLSEYRDDQCNLSGDNSAERAARFKVEEILAHDCFSEAEPKRVEISRHNLRILFEGEPSEGVVRLKVMALRRAETGQWRMSPEYVPPLLSLGASSRLIEIIEEFTVLLSAKRRALAAHTSGALSTDVTGSEVMRLWFLHTLNGTLARLKHVSDNPQLPPERTYEVLSACAGQLMTFADEASPLDLVAFTDEDLFGCFSALIDLINSLMEGVIPADYVQIALEKRSPTLWHGRLPRDLNASEAQFLLVLSGERPSNMSNESIVGSIKMASAKDIHFIRDAALRGVDLIPLLKKPTGAPQRPDALYLRVRSRGQFWKDVLSIGEVALYLPGQLSTLQPEFIAIL